MSRKLLPAVGAVVLLMGGTVGCGTQAVADEQVEGASVEHPAADPAPADPAPAKQTSDWGVTGGSEASRVKTYTSIDELANESDLVVVAEVSDDHTLSELYGVAFTDRVVIPERVLKGETAAEVTVFELGDGAEQFSLQPGTRHLLFLTAYELDRGVPTGKYAVTGVYAGDFLQNPDGSFKKLDDESPLLPATLPKEFSL